MSGAVIPAAASGAWPALPSYAEWGDTCATLHLWSQIVGKTRLALAPMVNHWWQVPLYVSARGLTTSAMPAGARALEVEFDFVEHALHLRTTDGGAARLPLEPMSVAEFHERYRALLASLGVSARIWRMPVELERVIPFDEDRVHASYDPAAAARFWRALVDALRVFSTFRGRFVGKCSPVHFFWGSFDLAVTRFSGRRAPPHPGGAPGVADWVMREAYSHEVLSAGFWPGNAANPAPVFYAYAYPEPPGFASARAAPVEARYDDAMREFLLPYDTVRAAPDPDSALLAFLESTYVAGADLARWDRAALERAP